MKHLAWAALLLFLAPMVLASTHGAYSEPRAGFSVSSNVQVDDTAVYKTGYVSENGSDWQAFTLSGSTERGDWALGTATAAIDLTNTRYVAIYSCTWSSGWDCSETWQVKDRGEQNTEDSQAGDTQALQSLYAAANGDSWNDNTGWSSSSMDLNQPIYGVSVETIDGEPRVTEIDLRDNGLTGNIDVPELGNLKELVLLNVMFNSLDSDYPAALHQATNLEYLYLSGSDETAPINKGEQHPHEKTTSVHVGKTKSNEYNKFHGAVPESLGNLQNLKWIMLSWTDDWSDSRSVGDSPTVINGITSIPDTLWDISTLQGIHIYENWNIGTSGNTFSLPDSIAHMQNLERIKIGGASGTSWDEDEQGFMTGTYPADMDQLTKLKYVSFGGNAQLSGIPDVRASTDLRQLTLANTDSGAGGGSLPAWLVDGTFANLDSMSLAWPTGQELTGTIPEFGSMTGLDNFGLTGHSFTGSIPESFWTTKPTGVKKFNFQTNELTSIGTTDLTHLSTSTLLRWQENEISEPWPNLNWDDPPPLASAYFRDNRYVFKHMLYVPDNAPNGETILELYDELVSRFDYTPQKAFGQAATRSVNTGGSITLDDFSSVVEHADNQYQWQLDGSSITGANSRELTINNAQSSDAGTYTLRVTNPGAPDLTLTSEPVTLSVTDASTDSKAGDETALEALYVEANGDSWNDNTGWSSSSMDLDQPIYGVSVETIDGQPRVTEIDLRDNGLTGSIDIEEWANLKELVLVNVAYNNLDTQYPNAIHQIGPSLEYLYLSYSDDQKEDADLHPHEYLATQNPPEFEPAKQSASRGDNTIRGVVNDDIDNLANLKYYVLSFTDNWGTSNREPIQVNGIQSLPMSLWNIETLEMIHFHENWNVAASGNTYSFPDSIAHMTQLKQISIGGGGGGGWDPDEQGFMTGTYPDDLGTLESIIAFKLSGNPELTGFPDLSSSSGLTKFALAGNNIGNLQASEALAWLFDGSAPNMDVVSINAQNFDSLVGPLPTTWNVPGIDLINMRYHEFTGAIPEGLWDMDPNKMNLGNNKLTSIGRTDLRGLQYMSTMRFYENEVRGEQWPILDWSRLDNFEDGELEYNENVDYTLRGQFNRIRFERNRYVFDDMLYVPDNAPNGETAFELYDSLSADLTLFSYSPQKPFGYPDSRSYNNGDDIVLDDFEPHVRHPDNQYQWERDGSEINGASNRQLTITDAQSSDSGTYTLVVTNPGVPSLTLTSEPIQVTVT